MSNNAVNNADILETFVRFAISTGPRLINVREVVEIIPMVQLDFEENTNTDGENTFYQGLLNYRGKVIPVFDPASNNKKYQCSADDFLIVTSKSDKGIALIANEVDELITVLADDISRIKPADSNEFTVAKINDEMLKIITTEDYIS